MPYIPRARDITITYATLSMAAILESFVPVQVAVPEVSIVS